MGIDFGGALGCLTNMMGWQWSPGCAAGGLYSPLWSNVMTSDLVVNMVGLSVGIVLAAYVIHRFLNAFTRW